VLAPIATLSKFQAARVDAAFAPANEASTTDAMQARVLVFIKTYL
jgi:hypothetical protein